VNLTTTLERSTHRTYIDRQYSAESSSAFMPIALPPPQLLEISGTDAVAFAHAQFCNDVIALPVGCWQWNAWLSPQGRVRHFFILLRDTQDSLRLLLRGGDANLMRAALARFVFRARLSLRTVVDAQAFGCDAAEALATLATLPTGDALVRHADCSGIMLPGPSPRWLLLRTLAAATAVEASLEALNGWRLDDIRCGLPELVTELEDQLLPQWLGLGRLGAISVGKGCYPGQEIMARLHFKGGNKRSLYQLQLHSDTLPAPGTPLFATGPVRTEVGTLVMAARSGAEYVEALAVVADTAIAAGLRAEPATAGEINVISGFA
jgi:folate-binding protein YgfZ